MGSSSVFVVTENGSSSSSSGSSLSPESNDSVLLSEVDCSELMLECSLLLSLREKSFGGKRYRGGV